jgi:hypothetical protein
MLRLDQEQRRPLVLHLRRDHKHLGLGAARDEGLHAVQQVPGALPRRPRLQRERVEHRPRLDDRQRGGRHVLAGEGRQVRRLLRLVAPQRDRRADRGRRETRDRLTHVAVRHRLGHQYAGHRRPLGDDPAQLLGYLDQAQPELGGPTQHLRIG